MHASKFAFATLALAFCGAALAANPDSITSALVFTPDSSAPNYAFATIGVRQLSPDQAFTDYYTFHLDGDQYSGFSFGVISDAMSNVRGDLQLKAAVFDSYQLIGPNGHVGGYVGDPLFYGRYSYEGLAAGDYTLELKGHAVGRAGGNYYGNAAIGAVPEPGVAAMGLAGLGIVALLSACRRKV